MLKENRLYWLYGGCLVFIVLNLMMMVQGVYWLSAMPVALGVMLMLFFSLDKLILLLVFLTPFSFKYVHEELGFAMTLPTEPVIVVIMLLFVVRLIYEGNYDKRVLRHPLTVFLIIQLLWMLVTTITSEMPLVSFKFFISRFWFVTTFFFIGVYLFRERKNMHRFMWLFGSALAVVVMMATYKHYLHGFEREVGYAMVQPFFNDHTHYGAVLALVAPFFIVMAFNRSGSVLRRRLAVMVFLLFCAGILFSFSRASWLSLIVAAGGFVILVFRLKFRFILAGLILLLGIFALFQTEIVMQLERNQQESSGDFSEHVQSITNITSDASNLERINRWRSAYRMYEERPVFGWGPGTYQFVYAPFQRAEDYTIITTHFGDLGNAHSEYIGPLSESGLPGMLFFIGLVLALMATGVKLYKQAPDREMRLIALGLTLGFITYLTHGLLNNFLDTDKASVPFWGMMAILVAMDVFYPKREQRT
ncbi:MAG: O-antigen ligase family protein [Bacteroidales bacterium]